MRAPAWVFTALSLVGCAEGGELTAAEQPSIVTSGRDAGAAHPEAEISTATSPNSTLDRSILTGHVENARDLGGVVLESGEEISAGALFRGPPLADLTAEGCAAVSELGIRSVIDLRVASEVSLRPDADCALARAQLVAAPLPVPYNVSAADYIAVLDARESIVRIFETLGDASRYPVYFHCTWGRDRTGIVAAVILLALRATPEAIMEDYLVSGQTVGAYPASLQAALEEIAARGGIAAYLAAVGVTAEQLDALRARAVDGSGSRRAD